MSERDLKTKYEFRYRKPYYQRKRQPFSERLIDIWEVEVYKRRVERHIKIGTIHAPDRELLMRDLGLRLHSRVISEDYLFKKNFDLATFIDCQKGRLRIVH